MSDRICVIGAGVSGLSTLHHFAKLEEAGHQIPEIVCYEKQADWCGLWNCLWIPEVDQYGKPLPKSMLKNSWSYVPKEAIEYPDYTFEEHFGKVTPSYTPREKLRDYLVGRFSRINIRKFIRFTHDIQRVVYNQDTNDFSVDVKDLKNNSSIMNEKFTHVVVCSGYFSSPRNEPEFPGVNDFPGRVLHSHDVRDIREFTGKRLLIVGASSSAEDIALESNKHGASQIIISWRSKPMGYKWPEAIEERPLLTELEGNRVYFKDGSSAEVDAIILCTGYKHNFPFLEDNLRLVTPNTLYPLNLYKGLLWMRGGNKKLFYVGGQNQYYTFTMFDIQALWVAQVIVGLKTLPSDEDMEKDISKWLERLSQLKDKHDDIDYQTDYVEDLCRETGFEGNVLAAEIFHKREKDKENDIATYRDQCFMSLNTGNMAVENKEDSVDV